MVEEDVYELHNNIFISRALLRDVLHRVTRTWSKGELSCWSKDCTRVGRLFDSGGEELWPKLPPGALNNIFWSFMNYESRILLSKILFFLNYQILLFIKKILTYMIKIWVRAVAKAYNEKWCQLTLKFINSLYDLKLYDALLLILLFYYLFELTENYLKFSLLTLIIFWTNKKRKNTL
jgi:hypothetical protein